MKFKENVEFVDIDIELITDDEKFARFYYNDTPTDYAVSTEGRVYNMKTNKLRKLRSRPDGRRDVNLSFGGKDNCRTFTVYRMVAEVFLEGQNKDDNINAVDHVDGDCTNDSVKNLEWVTHMENTVRAGKQGKMKKDLSEKGEGNKNHVYTEEQVRLACELKSQGVTKREICEQSGIKYDYLDKIFNGLKWSHISCEYNLVHKRKRKYPEGLKERIEELAGEGFSNPEIKDIVEQEFNIELTSSYVKDAKRNRRKK